MSAEENDLQEEVNKLYKKFEDDAHDKIKTDRSNYRLMESGQPRNFLKNLVSGIMSFADRRLDAEHQVKLYLSFAADFYEFGEYSLALESFQAIVDRCNSIPNELLATKCRVEAMQNIVKSNFAELSQLKGTYIAPMVVSKLLLCLQELRHSLEDVFELPTSQQEGLAWLVLNSCKLVMEIGQPLVWYSCGKYVTETIMFAAISMEAVINLCTVRHMKFRMKMYSAIFYSALAHSVTDQAAGVLAHTKRQVAELKEREELDPPVPKASTMCIQQCQLDVAVMQFCLDFWKDPDSFSLAEAHLAKYYQAPAAGMLLIPAQSFADLCTCECIRVHLLASGNTNEPFRKRSTCLLKGIAAAVQSFTPAATPSGEEKHPGAIPEVDAGRLKLFEKFTLRGILESAVIALFCATEGVDAGETLTKLHGLGQELAAYQTAQQQGLAETFNSTKGGSDIVVDYESLEQLSLLHELHQLTHNKTAGAARAKQVLQIAGRFEALTYSDFAYRTRAFLKKASTELWRTFLYPAVQEVLSDLQKPDTAAASRSLLAEIAPTLLTAVKVLDITALEDPVLMGSMALLAAQVQWELRDHRGSIALAQQAIYTLDEHRMGRVDALQHIPEDVRDIFALQRGSFSTRGDNQDWFHSLKRLGAHAFAGYGIFGLSSSADRGDQAMSEVQADLVAFYFRTELTYCVQQLVEKQRIRDILHREEKARTAAADALLKGIKLKPVTDKASKGATLGATGAKTGALGVTGAATLVGGFALTVLPTDGVNSENLPVVPSLRSFCSKNCYYRCILLIEMARIDTDGARKISYLHDAVSAVEECEGREQLLKESFAELLVMTETDRSCPLVVARSHRYIYVAPVGCRKLKKAAYYRVFAKEKGSGTDVSLHNDDLAGCEKRIRADELHNLRNSVVRIGPLRPGEQYVFASAGFTPEDKASGGLSPTSVVVDAVNPLPTILLWSWLTQSAQEIGYLPLSKEVSLRVVNRYFMQSPTPESRVVGKGFNLFLFREPSLCMLALHQSSPLLMQYFVDSCLSYEALYQSTHLRPHSRVNWTKDRSNQLSALTSLHRIALVCTVACGLQNFELTLRCVKLGYDVALELIRFDLVHLSGYLTGPLNVLVLAMQTTPKRHWGILEHKLYSKVLAHAAKVGAVNANVTPVASVLNTFYPEVLSGSPEEIATVRPPAELLADYSATFSSVLQCIASTHVGPFIDQAKKLFKPLSVEEHTHREADTTTATSVGYLWSMPAIQRKLQLLNVAADLLKPPDEKATPERLQLEKWLTTDRPQHMSDYLCTLVQLAKEISRGPAASDVHKLVQRLPICESFLAPRVVEASSAWKVTIAQTLAAIVANSSAQPATLSPRTAAAAAKKGGAKGATPELTEAELHAAKEAALKIPERFLEVSSEEEVLQLRYFGELLFILAVHSYPGATKSINSFPKSVAGPRMHIDPNTFTVDRSVFKVSPEQVPSVPSTQVSPRTAGAPDGTALPTVKPLLHVPLTAADHVRLLSGALHMLKEAGSTAAAAQVACSIWRFVKSEWVDPLQFATDFAASQEFILKVFASITELVEQMSYVAAPAVLEEDEASVGDGSHSPSAVLDQEPLGELISDAPVSYQREVKENILAMRDLIVFLLKVEWIIGSAFWDVVQLGSRVFRTMFLNCPEFLKDFGDDCLPLIMNAQEGWIEQAVAFKALKQGELDNFVFQYEEAQRKKRKKKLRIARLEKDEEELLFEAERSIYEQRVEEAHQALLVTHEEMKQVKIQQAKFDKRYSNGSRALDRVRGLVRLFLDEVKSVAANHPDGPLTNYAELLGLYPELDEKLHILQNQFRPVVSILREKKEKVLLVEALKLLGDMLLLFHRIAEAKSAWNDTIDGLFNVMDACTEWVTVSSDAVASLEPHLIPGILPAITALSKLSRYCASQDWDAKAGYARMAAELCRIPFQGSFGHPLTVVGFAAYQCQEVGGLFSLGMRAEALSATDFSTALNEVLSVLIAEKQFIPALPVAVLLEHFCAVYLSNPSLWLSARLLRTRLLISSHLFAEAAAMIASIRFTVREIHSQSFADAWRSQYSKHNEVLKDFETSENGLNYFGYAPYFNNLPPDDEKKNSTALQWISAFPAEFETFAKDYRITLPTPVLTPEEQAAEAERKAKAAEEAAAAAAAKKGPKGAKGKEPEVVEVVEPDNSTAPMFSAFQVAEMHITCASLLLEVSMLDSRSTTPHAAKLVRLGAQGLEGLTKATAVLFSTLPAAAPAAAGSAESPDLLSAANVQHVRNKDWLRLYGRVHVLRNCYHVHVRNIKEVRASCMNMLDLLRSKHLAQGIDGDTRGVLTQIWFTTRDLLITVADRQARFKDVLQLSTQSAREASMQLAGHWLRSFLLHRATANFKLGNIEDALQDCKSCTSQFENNKLEDLQLVRCLCLQATVLREQAVYAAKDQCVQAYLESLALIRRAGTIAEALAYRSGAYPADSNVTYARADTAVKRHHMIAPVMQSLTDLHINEPNLALTAQFNKRKLHQHMGIDIPSLQITDAVGGIAGGAALGSNTMQSTNISTKFQRGSVDTSALATPTEDPSSQSSVQKFKLNSLRLAPVDRKEFVYCESEFANINLEENRVLLTCQTILCQVLDDARNAGLAGNRAFLDVYEPNALVNEQLAMGESALKLTRHCVYLPTVLRVSTLAYVSKARIGKKSKFEGDASEFLNTLVGPLTAALEVTVKAQATQLWALVRTICIELVEVYGDHDLDLGEEIGPQRLKMAVIYLLTAIKVSNQHANLTKNSIGLASDPSFDANPSEELKKLVINLSSSSATPDIDELRRNAVAEAEAAAAAAKAPPAKGKPVKAAAPMPGAGSTLAPNGRDALYLFCALLRERDPLWTDTTEQQLCADLHSLLRAAYPLYNSKCCLAECPNPSGNIDVANSTVSTLYIPTKAPEAFTAVLERQPNEFDYSKSGLYSHVSVFFLLGDAVTPTATTLSAGDGANSKEPILTKLVLPKVDVVHIEKTLRNIRDTLLDAEKKSYTSVIKSCQRSFGDVLVLLLGLMKNGIITQEKSSAGDTTAGGAEPAFQLTEGKAANGAAVCDLVISVGDARTPVMLRLTADLILHFAEVFCPDKDTELQKDNFVCAFIRAALGYKVSAK